MSQPHPHNSAPFMARRAQARRAMTLLELTAVTIVIGLLGLVAATFSRLTGFTPGDNQPPRSNRVQGSVFRVRSCIPEP